MKRRLSVVLIGLMAVLSIAGCGKKNNNQQEVATKQSNIEEEADTSKNEDNKEEQSDVEEADTDGVDPCMDAIQLSDEVFKAYAKEEWQIAYKDILDSMYDGTEYVHDEIKDANYYLYDMDKDGIPELIVKRGSNENDYMSDFYYWDGNEVKYAGEEFSGRLQYYSNPDGNGIIEYSMHMASGYMTKSLFVDGKIVADEDFFFEDDLMSRYEMDLEADPIPVSEVVKGSEQLRYYCPKYTYPILSYLEPVYAAGREELTDDEFKDMINKIVDEEVEIYWVPTENYVLKDYIFKPNKMSIHELMDTDGFLFDDTDGMYVYVKNYNYMDFNGDGYTECLMELRNATNDDLSLVLLTYQHGNIYAYTSRYMGDWSLKIDNGEIFASGIYNGGMKISYEYCLDQAKMNIEKNDVVIFSDDARDSLEKYFRGEIKSKGSELGVAYIGSAGNYSGEYLVDVFEDTKKEFSDLKFMGELGKCHVVKQPGEEVYVLVPADEKYVISVYEQEWGDFDPDVYPKRGKLLYKATPGEVVVVRCNQSDIVSNIEISMDMNGKELVYSPNMSLDDGSLVTEDGVYDFGKTNLILEDEYWDE